MVAVWLRIARLLEAQYFCTTSKKGGGAGDEFGDGIVEGDVVSPLFSC